MKVLFYCQYVYGMGHLFRSLELVRAFKGHQVLLVVGGRKVEVDIPSHVELVRLPSLYMDEHYTTLISPDPHQTVEQIQQNRLQTLESLLYHFRPDVLMTELYPFGRSFFEYELMPIITDVRRGRFGRIKTVCSLRDVLVEKRDTDAYEQRVIDRLNAWYDLLLVHTDPNVIPLADSFNRVSDIAVPVYYTGFVVQGRETGSVEAFRQSLNLTADHKLIVASAGGGRSGFHLLNTTLEACQRLVAISPLRLHLFAGPFMDEGQFQQLEARSTPDLQVKRFTRRFLDYLHAADLSISMAGYNTCMNLLVTGVPALVFPYARQQEQPMRVDKIQGLIPFKRLNQSDLTPSRLMATISDMLSAATEKRIPDINTNGAEHTVRYMVEWMAAQ